MTHIGIFDSGVGGLTVFQAICEILPSLSITYLGDTARLPYGEKSPEAILRFSKENISFLTKHQVSMIVFACHTASAVALEPLEKTSSLPLLGVIDPAICKALATTRNGRIGILGTRRTISSCVYQKRILAANPNIHVVPIICPLLVPLIEEQMIQHEATYLITKDYLTHAICENVDTIILGCTHYPLLTSVIQRIMGEKVHLIDSAKACAQHLKQMINPNTIEKKSAIHRFFVSDDPEKFRESGERILNQSLSSVELI